MTKNQSLRDAVLKAKDFRKAPVSVPEWNLEEGLFVRSMNILHALAFEKANQDVPPERMSSLYLAYTLCDEDGELILDPSDQQHLDELIRRDPDVISRLFNEALDLNTGPTKAKGEPTHEEKPSPNLS